MNSLIQNTAGAALSGALKLLSMANRKRSLSILIFHSVLQKPDSIRPHDIDAESFNWQMKLVSENYTSLCLSEAVNLLKNDRLPKNALCVTFDDGYADNEAIALPILLKWNVPATFFVSTGYLNGGRMWNDSVIEGIRGCQLAELDLSEYGLGCVELDTLNKKLNAIDNLLPKLKYRAQDERQEIADVIANSADAMPNDLMMTTTQVRRLHAAGMEIGGHTISHPILATLAADTAKTEICGGKEQLESIIAGSISSFAYPNGKIGNDYTEDHVNLVKRAGFDAAVSTTWGVSRQQSDYWQLPRFTPWDKTSNMYLYRLIRNSL